MDSGFCVSKISASIEGMRCQLNQEMLWPTNSQKQIFDNYIAAWKLTLSYSFQPVYFLQYRA